MTTMMNSFLKIPTNRIRYYLDYMDTNSLCVNDELMSFTEEQQNQCYSILRECTKHHIQILWYVIRLFFFF